MHGLHIRKSIKSEIKKCRKCAAYRAIPYHYPTQPELPLERLQAKAPFCSTGVDLCGPFEVRSGYGRCKVWVTLFTCLVSRAVYLVPVKDLSALTFLDALWELSSRRGQPSFLFSDNATNFTKAAKLLDSLAKDRQVEGELSKKGINWSFNTPYAPWKGGSYERLIGLLKHNLDNIVALSILTEHEFRQNIYEVERVLNDRPLTRVGDNQVITPAHILGQGNPNFDTDFSGLDRALLREVIMREQNNLPHLFTQSQERLTKFWKSFWNQYLCNLRFSGDRVGNKFKRVPKVGDICIIWQDDPRKKWKKCLILELMPSRDGKIRQCKVKIGSSVTTRAVNQLFCLEIEAEQFAEECNTGIGNKTRETLDISRPVEAIQRPPRRVAAIAATNRNRDLLLEDHYFQ